MTIQENKQKCFKTIEQYNDAITTCIDQDNISALQDTYKIRDKLIHDFFNEFSSILTDADQAFFEKLKAFDSDVTRTMKGVKNSIVDEVSFRKKSRSGINNYQQISKEK